MLVHETCDIMLTVAGSAGIFAEQVLEKHLVFLLDRQNQRCATLQILMVNTEVVCIN
jgi:hypothetical protein